MCVPVDVNAEVSVNSSDKEKPEGVLETKKRERISVFHFLGSCCYISFSRAWKCKVCVMKSVEVLISGPASLFTHSFCPTCVVSYRETLKR